MANLTVFAFIWDNDRLVMVATACKVFSVDAFSRAEALGAVVAARIKKGEVFAHFGVVGRV